MMSTGFLYHGFAVRGYKYVHTRYKNGEIIFKIEQKPEHLRCSICGTRQVIRRGKIGRYFRTLPVGSKCVWIFWSIRRVFCPGCQLVRQAKIGFADPRRSYTKAFERYALELCQHMTMLDVASHLDVSWDVIKDIQKRYLKKRFARPKLKKLKRIAIDEIGIGKEHRYLSVVLDLATGAVVFIGDGKGSQAMNPFWKRVKRTKAEIDAVAIDMSPAYISAITEKLPTAAIVFDRFHVVKLFNDKLSDLLRKPYHDATSVLVNYVIKRTRWLLLKNPENLDQDRNEHLRLKEALRLNQPLATVYYMKEDLRQLSCQTEKCKAESFLNDWIARARASKITMLIRFANTLAAHRTGILTFYDHNISTVPLEGTNNKIKTMKRQAYGFRDMEFFKLKIMAIHTTKYALVG